jgi:hypothetical protein
VSSRAHASLQPLGGKTGEAREVGIFGEQRRHAALAAERDDLRVEDEIARASTIAWKSSSGYRSAM